MEYFLVKKIKQLRTIDMKQYKKKTKFMFNNLDYEI